MADTIELTGQNQFLATIGHICLQWALIEQGLLALIGAAEHMPLEKTYTRYGTTDMIPRLRLTFRLTIEAGWPVQLTKRIKAVQTVIAGGLNDRRNLFVHGVHGPINEDGEVELTMARWPSGKRKQTVTALDGGVLAVELHEVAQEVHAIFDDYGRRKFGMERRANRDEQVAQANALARRMRAKNIKRALKLLFANLKFW
jgi:hypothetical protein